MAGNGSIESNKKVVTDFWQAFSESRFDDAMAQLHDDARWTVMGKTHISGPYTKAEFTELVMGIADSTESGIQVTPTVLTAEANRVAMEAVSHGQLKNGRVYANEYHLMHELRDGKLIAIREYMDTEHVTEIFGP